MRLMTEHREVIRRSQESVVWWMRNFVKIKHPSAGLLKFDPFDYQVKSLRAYKKHKNNIHTKPRQAGVSKIAGAFALWYGQMFPNKTILVVSRTDGDAKEFLDLNIRFPFNNQPEWMRELWKPIKDNEHEFFLPNGTKIRSLTSHKDVLRSNASSLNIIDEAAHIQHMSQMWAAGQSTLLHGGCLSGDSLVLGSQGLLQIGDLHKSDSVAWEDIGFELPTDTGTGFASKSYHNGIVRTRRITTSDGHYVEASYKHRFRVLDENGGYEWKLVKDIKAGDQLVLSDKPYTTTHETKLDTDIFNHFTAGCKICGEDYKQADLAKVAKSDEGWCPRCITTVRMLKKSDWKPPKTLDCNLATMLGALWGDGFCNEVGTFGFSCDRTYPDFIEYLHGLVGKFGGNARDEVSDKDWSVRFNNKALWLLLAKNGIVKSNDITELRIPRMILSANTAMQAAFLRGLFETDGSISGHYTTLSSSSIFMIRQVQTMLLAMGMRSRIYEAERTNGFSDNPQYILSLKTIKDVVRFRSMIGFISKRKKARLAKVKISDRQHNDRYINKAALRELHLVGAGLPQKCRSYTRRSLRRSAIPRASVKKLAKEHQQLATTTLGMLALNDLFTDKIESIEESTCRTYDITEDSKNTYIANGFVSHNSVIVISTPAGVGGWYWGTCTDAEAKANSFNLIKIKWWDMTWRIEYVDSLLGVPVVIAPTDGILECGRGKFGEHPRFGRVELIPERYGKYWSPWLETQWRDLQDKGEGWKFEQEVLGEFVGSGNTILDKATLLFVGNMASDQYEVVTGHQTYVNSVTGESELLDFTPPEPGEGLRIWHKPILGETKAMGGRLISTAHTYVAGVDIATGRGRDYHAVEIFDVNDQCQAAELMVRCLPSVFKRMLDWLGRWYNNCLLVIERNNGGENIIDDMQREFAYPRLWRKTGINDRPNHKGSPITYSSYGFFTGQSTKPILNKHLVDHIKADDTGVRIYSHRLLKQLNIYVRKKDKAGNDTGRTEAVSGPGNHDDLVISTALAFVGFMDAMSVEFANILPVHATHIQTSVKTLDEDRKFISAAPAGALFPFCDSQAPDPLATVQAELEKLHAQLTGTYQSKPVVVSKKHKL